MDQFESLQKELSRRVPSLEVREREPMSKHTSFRIGGPARLMALPKSEEEAVQAVRTAMELGVTPFFMGRGSNLLASDRGVEKFIVKTVDGLGHMRADGDGGIAAGSGVLLSQLAGFALGQGLTGLEFAHGIPGSLGGAVTMNAGAYGGEMAQVVKSVTCLNRDGAVEVLSGEEARFEYRHSAFSDGARLVLGARLKLSPGSPESIRARMEELSTQRRAKQPLEYPSAGSMFKRPAGHFAAALIQQCGLKGLTVGGAQVSEKHAGFVVNRGGATCCDVLELVEQVRRRVLEQTGVSLEMEVKVLE